MPLKLILQVLLASTVMAWSDLAKAHGDEDHGAAPATVAQAGSPRAVATSEDYEIVAILKNGHLMVYVDRATDNSPVIKAALTITVNGKQVAAQVTADGVYEIEGNELLKAGHHELLFEIKDGSASDLLITTLDVPEAIASKPPAQPQRMPVLDRVKTIVTQVKDAIVSRTSLGARVGFGVLISGLVLAVLLVRRRRRRAADLPASPEPASESVRDGDEKSAVTKLRVKSAGQAAAALALVLLAWPQDRLYAHGGEDHGDGSSATVSGAGDAPRRLPDASVFLPKPSQRLLEVRTTKTKEDTTQPSISLVGRVIANPDKFGVVQSTLGGRITPPKPGLPKIGQAVKAGEVLGYVAPYIAAIDRSDAAQTAGTLEQEIALAEARLVRAKRLFAVNAGTRVQVEERQIELDGLKKRRAALSSNTSAPEPLVAPISGVIAGTKVVVGQVVDPKDILFEIIDPASLWVEAYAFDQATPEAFSEVSATAQEGAPMKLKYIGRSRTLRQQSTLLQFAIETPPASLNVGMPVSVLARAGEPVKGIVLPKTAIVRAPNGENIVWQHKEPERFVPVPVKVSTIDGERVLVERGLKPDERVVVSGAELINQVR